MKTAWGNIDMDFKEMWFEGLNRIQLSQDIVLLVGSCKHGNELSGVIKSGDLNSLSHC
jgi:hypothetical protein